MSFVGRKKVGSGGKEAPMFSAGKSCVSAKENLCDSNSGVSRREKGEMVEGRGGDSGGRQLAAAVKSDKF